jgi:hypothetical protein
MTHWSVVVPPTQTPLPFPPFDRVSPASDGATVPIPLTVQVQRLMAQNLALKAQTHRLVSQSERDMTRIHYLTTQVDELLSRLDQRDAQIQKVHRQLDRHRQRERRADQSIVDVTPVTPLSNPNPAIRNARGHYVQLAFWPRKQHRPIVRTCLHLIAASLVVGFTFMLGLVVLQLLGQTALVAVLLDFGLSLARVIIAIGLVSGLIVMVSEAV